MSNFERVWASAGDVLEPSAGMVEAGWGTTAPPKHDWQNWFMNLVAVAMQSIERTGAMEWDAEVPYSVGVPVVYAGGYYCSLVANTGLQPDVNPVQWKQTTTGNPFFHALGGDLEFATTMTNALNGKSDSTHEHDGRYYTETETNNLLGGKSDTSHTHDSRYYTETEINNFLAGKAGTTHFHDAGNITTGEFGANRLAVNSVGQSEILAGAVHQGELATATSAGSVSIPGNTDVSYLLTGGTYSWWTASATANRVPAFGGGDLAAGQIGIHNSGASGTFYVNERYVSASPPYDLGDGEVPLFIHLLIDSSGGIVGCNVAQDPTWAYHGDHDITPEWIDKKTRKGFRSVYLLEGTDLTLREAMAQKSAAYDDYLAGNKILVPTYLEITNEYKNLDMEEHSSPWARNSESFLTGKTVALVDPVGAQIDRLAEISRELGPKHILSLIDGDYLRVDNTEINRASPRNLKVHGLNWRDTKKSK